jgi:citrate synthase
MEDRMPEGIKLTIEGKELEFPVIVGTENEKALDISALRKETGYITLDNGFVNTGSCSSGVTFLNGEQGILRYRGYPIEQLADKSNFIEVSYLLNYGELPSAAELEKFRNDIRAVDKLPEGVERIIDQFPKTAHPMGVMSTAISSLSAFHPEFLDPNVSKDLQDKAVVQLMGQLKIALTRFYRNARGKPVVASDKNKTFCEDFLNMMFNEDGYTVDPKIEQALDVLLMLHADHEQNCSASTVRVVGSSHANVFACVSAGIDALWGQLHGGANQAVLEMLQAIQDGGGDHKVFLEKAKDKSDPFRLMGFGHRVYKNFDPRARIIKKACDTVLETLGVDDPLLGIAKGLEEEALKDEYFVKRNLYPNVDFYSGIIYKALDIPVNMFTAMFALGRLPGWLAQWRELRNDPAARIARPRQIYIGANERNYVEAENR